MIEFHNTKMGRKFYEADLPRLIEVLDRIGKHMEQSNQLQEKKYKLDEKLTRLQIKNLNESSNPDKVF